MSQENSNSHQADSDIAGGVKSGQTRQQQAGALPPPEEIEVTTASVSCKGGAAARENPALGHPQIFLKIGEAGFVDCPYCDARFRLKP